MGTVNEDIRMGFSEIELGSRNAAKIRSKGYRPSSQITDSPRVNSPTTTKISLVTLNRKDSDSQCFDLKNCESKERRANYSSSKNKKSSTNISSNQIVSPTMNNGDTNNNRHGDRDSNDTDSEDDEDEDEDDDEDKHNGSSQSTRKAPNELIMEFLTTIMSHEYTNAKNLCDLILVYEPANSEALKFLPLINEKLQMDEDNNNNDDSSSSDESSEDGITSASDDDSDTDVSDTDSNDSDRERMIEVLLSYRENM